MRNLFYTFFLKKIHCFNLKNFDIYALCISFGRATLVWTLPPPTSLPYVRESGAVLGKKL